MLWEHVVAGSNPVIPIDKKYLHHLPQHLLTPTPRRGNADPLFRIYVYIYDELKKYSFFVLF
jgi:hypothetical protein